MAITVAPGGVAFQTMFVDNDLSRVLTPRQRGVKDVAIDMNASFTDSAGLCLSNESGLKDEGFYVKGGDFNM